MKISESVSKAAQIAVRHGKTSVAAISVGDWGDECRRRECRAP